MILRRPAISFLPDLRPIFTILSRALIVLFDTGNNCPNPGTGVNYAMLPYCPQFTPERRFSFIAIEPIYSVLFPSCLCPSPVLPLSFSSSASALPLSCLCPALVMPLSCPCPAFALPLSCLYPSFVLLLHCLCPTFTCCSPYLSSLLPLPCLSPTSSFASYPTFDFSHFVIGHALWFGS